MDETRCREEVQKRLGWGYFYQCSRKIWKDGYCKQHHPESVKKRQEKATRRHEESQKKTCWYKLNEAQKTIVDQAAEIKRLKAELEKTNKEMRLPLFLMERPETG